MEAQRVLIVGGGIGGLSTAIALRLRGFAVHVVEIKPDMESSVQGVGIVQPVNALRALEAIGCAAACMAEGYATTAWGMVLDVNGNELRQIPGAKIPGSDLPPMNGITRPRFHAILTEKALASGATIDYGKTFSGLADGPDGVAVAFSDGTTGNFDLVVGADGVYSKVRRHVLGDAVRPIYNGLSSFRANIPRKIPGEMEIDRIIIQEGPEAVAGYVPIGPDLAYVFYNKEWDRDDRPDENRLDALFRACLEPFGGLTGTVRDRYIDDPRKVVLRPQEWLIAPPPWHKGRVVLIGDAVHAVTPHLGQGAAQAIEDGIVLAECLAAAATLDAAFTRYTERRYERCRLIVESSVTVGEWEMNPAEGGDYAALRQRVFEAMAAPI